jgi:serine/threonine/tyrosine-interacting protein
LFDNSIIYYPIFNMDKSSTYQRNQPTQFRISESRAIVIPPALIDYEGGKQTVRLPSECTPISRTNEQYGNPQFLAHLANANPLRLEHVMSHWEYRNRTTAQVILPFLLLGPMNSARDPEFLRKAGVTMLVAVRSKRSVEKSPHLMNPLRFPSAEGLVTATFDIDSAFDAIRGRSIIIKTMNDHIEASCASKSVDRLEDIPAKILVFCETGNERSPVLVAMYLMVVWGLDAVSAYQAVQARRFGIGLLPTMVDMLESLSEVLKAERQVMATQREFLAVRPLKDNKVVKRNIEETFTSDDDRDNDMDSSGSLAVEHTTRPGTAPFSDKAD